MIRSKTTQAILTVPGMLTGIAALAVLSAPIAAATAITPAANMAAAATFTTVQDEQSTAGPGEIPAHDPADEVDLGDGLIIIDLVEGDGPELVPQSLATVNYTGWLAADGTEFDSTLNEGDKPFTTSIPGQLIEGWNKGLIGMREGGVRKLIIPSELAYGSRAMGKIPPDSDLVFRVEAVEVFTPPTVDPSKATKTEDGGLYIDLEKGEGEPLEQNGFGHVHLIVWDDEGNYRGTTRNGEPLLVKTNQERYWVPYTLGMRKGGQRIVEIDDPSPMPPKPQPQQDTEAADGAGAGDGTDGAAARETTPTERGRWTMWLEMTDVVPALAQTPHDPEDEQELNDGLVIVDLKEGSGEEIPEHAIPVINYTGWLEDGTLVDSTYMPGNEPVFASPGLVIKGWEEGVKGMTVGGKRKIIIPPALGYGDRGYARLGIPPNATLIYEVELVRYEMPLFLPVDGEGGGLFQGLEEALKELDEKEQQEQQNDDDDGGGQ